MAEAVPVTFTDDIPTIQREGFKRDSKYIPILDATVERAGKAAKLAVDSQGQASSRASSLRDAASNHAAEKDGRGLFIVATRSGDDDGEFAVYVKFAEKGTEDYEGEASRRRKLEERQADPERKPRKKAVRKAQKVG